MGRKVGVAVGGGVPLPEVRGNVHVNVRVGRVFVFL